MLIQNTWNDIHSPYLIFKTHNLEGAPTRLDSLILVYAETASLRAKTATIGFQMCRNGVLPQGTDLAVFLYTPSSETFVYKTISVTCTSSSQFLPVLMSNNTCAGNSAYFVFNIVFRNTIVEIVYKSGKYRYNLAPAAKTGL